MSDFSDFLREAKAEVSAAKFEHDVEAGLISDLEYGSRLRLVGNPKAPLASNNGFKTVEAWRADCSSMPTELPVFLEFEQTAKGWIEIE
jgi:hypothetical protein